MKSERERRSTREKRKRGRSEKRKLLREQQRGRRSWQLIRKQWRKVSDKLRLTLLLRYKQVLTTMMLEATQCSEFLSKLPSLRNCAIESLRLQLTRKLKLNRQPRNPKPHKRMSLIRNSRRELSWLLLVRRRKWLSSQLL